MMIEENPQEKKIESPPPEWFAREISAYARRGSPERVALLGFALKQTNNDFPEAENIVAVALARALQHHDKFERGTSMSAWLNTILRNQYLSLKRSESVRARNDVNTPRPEIEDGAAVILDAVYDSQRRALIARLPEEQRRIISALEKHGSFDIAAKELGLPVQSVQESLRSAVASLSEMEGEEAPGRSPLSEKQSVETFLTQDDLNKLLPKIPKNQREAYIATVIEKKTHTEAAALFGVAEGTIKSRVSRARDRLAQLKGVDVDKATATDRLRQWYVADPQEFEKALKILDPRELEMIRRRIMLGQSTSEVAEETKLLSGSVSAYMWSAYKKLSDSLP